MNVCYGCREPFTDAHPPVSKFSAYSAACVPPAPSWRVPLRGNMAQCVACHEVFTTTRAFDSHHAYVDGKLTCRDPRRMFDRKHRRKLVLTTRGWGRNPDLSRFDTFNREAK